MRFAFCILTLLALSAATLAGEYPGTAIVQLEILDDENGESLYDPSLYISVGQVHAQFWAGDFTEGYEIGGYLKDSRRSAYSVAYRYRKDLDSVVHVETEQVVKNGYVAVGSVRFIHSIPELPGEQDTVQFGAGFDKYHGDYDFFSFRLFRDPRDDHHLTAVISHRFSKDAKRWVTLGLVPRSDDEVGAFVQSRWNWLRAGVGRYNRFDFTDVDRTIWNLGLQFDF